MPIVPKDTSATRDEKINIRAQAKQRALIDRAAEVLGKSRSDFMLEAACQKAEDVLLDRRIFSLNQKQWDEFSDLLDAPVAPNPKLQNLLQSTPPWEI
jgi:uncharacterized protein (DUF1778 family)